ncbi:hypothetical protein BRADI_1g73070v3 [Brachypodium distachyon]|uniref:Cystatin domain-containing protein n=1 Tax=Brachypodium distachyon TaxID=15368 RepID=I1H964_BRADI|nr:hypothetical protein BRADI_1g73070v3 [Brachypodium distachyon]
MRSLAAILFFLLLVDVHVGTVSALGFEKPPVTDIVMPADPRGPLLARFALLVHGMHRNARLKYVGVSSGEQHPEKGGIKYQMVITATDASGGTGKYRAVVWGVPETSQWMLLEFKRVVN